MGSRTTAVSLIESQLELQPLATHLRDFHLVKVPERKEMLLRWYDTRILPVWVDILTPGQRAGFLGPMQSWRYFDRFGQEQTIPCDNTDENTVTPCSAPYALSQAQYDTLLTASEPDLVIAQLRRIIPDEMRRLGSRTLYPFIKHHTHTAIHYGASTIDEQVQYVLVALYTGGRCIKHDDFIRRKEQVTQAADVPGLSDWLQTLPNDIWNMGLPLWETVHTNDLSEA